MLGRGGSIIILFLIGVRTNAQINCKFQKLVFSSGESLAYEVYYHWGLIWANAGESVFSTESEDYHGKKVLHLKGTGSTYKSYDWFYTVRDRFDSWVDTSTLAPLRYIRNTKEGSTRTYNDNYFNYVRKQAVCYKIIKNKAQKDSVKLKDCTFDVLTMIYYARCIDYSIYKTGAKIRSHFIWMEKYMTRFLFAISEKKRSKPRLVKKIVLSLVPCSSPELFFPAERE